jgi:hypothetical protein
MAKRANPRVGSEVFETATSTQELSLLMNPPFDITTKRPEYRS